MRLVCEDKLDAGMIDSLNIDEIDLINDALDEWHAAEARARKKAKQ